MEDQLKEFFQNIDDNDLYINKRVKVCKYAIEDIYDGIMFKERRKKNMISLNFSIDGIPISKSKNNSVYPVVCTINELHPIERRNKIVLSSVWVGSGKPKSMNSYLKPFVDEAIKLYHEGFTYIYDNKEYKKYVVVLLGVCDSVARPLVRCSTQFNGEYGCGLCLHPGEEIKKGKGHTRVYPVYKKNAFGKGIRTHEETLKHAEKKNKKNKKGIKCRSIICNIPGFNIINGLDVDWMHCVGLGVVRQIVRLWFDKKNKNESFYFGKVINKVDDLILSFFPTSDFSRTPRPMRDRAYLKAHEWISFLLIYSLPVLKLLFPKKIVDHWALLVDGISILIKKSILKSELVYADKCLFDFIIGVEKHYGKENVSFNVHLLAHLTVSVKNWGPLWTHSAFIYEDFYQTLKAYVKSSKGIQIQICDSFRLKCAIDRLSIICHDHLNLNQVKYLDEMLNRKSIPSSDLIIDDTGILENPVIFTNFPKKYHSILKQSKVQFNENDTFYIYKRAIIGEEVITSECYTREKKRSNSNVQLENDKIFRINIFISIKRTSGDSSYMIGNYFISAKKSLIPNRELRHLIVLKQKQPQLVAVSTKCVKRKVTVFEMIKERQYIACINLCQNELLI